MINILKSSIFKLFKDKTFRITLIVGLILGVLISLLYYTIDISSRSGNHEFCNGVNILITTFSPTQNFGIAIPINLIILIVGEFTFGTIRNKVIVGYKKSQIYISLFVVGLIFTFSLMLLYVLLSITIGTILGGWNPNNILPDGGIIKFILICLSGYVFVTSISIFFASITRHIGSAIGITIFVLIFCMILAIVTITRTVFTSNLDSLLTFMWIDPLFYENSFGIVDIFNTSGVLNETKYFLPGLLSPLLYSAIFVILGTFIFSKRDLK